VIIRKSADEIAKMREAGKVVNLVLREVQAASRPGVSTLDLDRVAADIIRDNGCKPSFLHYRGTFPAVICTSPNDAIVHGIPGNYRLTDGDILSVDAGAIYEGYQADAAVTYPIGHVPEKTATLIRVTEQALHAGIAQAVHGNRLSDISYAVELVARPHGYGIVREYVGHGIGQLMHEDPQIPNYGPPGKGPRIKEGMCFAIEPMFNMGSWETRAMPDGWTVRTMDGSLSAHFEHTVAVTDAGPEILTLP
jgi:methionyl aminopeptidase